MHPFSALFRFLPAAGLAPQRRRLRRRLQTARALRDRLARRAVMVAP